MDPCRCLRLQYLCDLPELLAGDDGGKGALDPYGVKAVLGGDAPDQGARVGLVGEHRVDGRLVPTLAPGGGDALAVECLGQASAFLSWRYRCRCLSLQGSDNPKRCNEFILRTVWLP